MITRFAEAYLEHWYQKSHRKPLVLRGARQVGKSTLVRQFAQKASLKLHEINLERYMDMDDVFKTLDIVVIIRELESIIGANIQQPNSLLFLDEIQATPHALQALRYFYEDTPELPVIAAGSLLEFTLAEHSFPMPVGRIEYYHLGPITFKEFLQATEPHLIDILSTYTPGDTIPIHAHRTLAAKQREYLFTGGMPEAAQVYMETGAVTDVSAVHRSIAETYQDDFSKYARQKELALMQQIFRMIPGQIGQKVKYSKLAREQRAKDVKAILELLTKAQICHKVYHSPCAGVPLFADFNENTYKLIFMDIGIVNH
ncbi:MAG: ATP-binding protein, partial [bacterium]|nr:ATP-binding protein [bacterium]